MILLQEFELFFGRTDGGRTEERTHGRTDRLGSQNSYLDEKVEIMIHTKFINVGDGMYSGLSNKRAARLFVSEEFFLPSRLLESTY